ncbi:hypothetical protein GCM10007320_28290 [Pseudorhodoferax aquiterrae]|uniref:Uncharacterized protein n=1 Tax=Pseudorhodoferax aquiterrae TaxID=747304 RepID=A0ABQ3G301_9BURK|nr:hypothetical protein GCM10007320_28290 [Pseudorhodoferax aquiterrae]
MVDQRQTRAGRIAHVVDLPGVLARTFAHRIGEHGVVFHKQQVHGPNVLVIDDRLWSGAMKRR